MNTLPESTLECRDLRVHADSVPVLDGVSFSMRAGESLVVVGPNGSGKTTLLRALLGLVPITGGKILWNGRPLQDLSRLEIARLAAYMPQLPECPPGFTVSEYVLTARYARRKAWGRYDDEDRIKAASALERIGMTSFSSRPVALLSGGEFQKVLLAAAVAQETPFLLLDEPAAFLDYHHQMDIMALVEQLRQERNLAVIMVTHDLNIPFLAGARLLALKQGKTLFLGPVSELPRQQAILEILYDTPFRIVSSGEGGWYVHPVFPAPGEKTP